MRNWSTDEKYLKKFPREYKIWRLTQTINYGLDEGEKLNKSEVVKFWPQIENKLDSGRRDFLSYLIWGNPS